MGDQSTSHDTASKQSNDATTPQNSEVAVFRKRKPRQRRTRVNDKPNHSVNLWSIMKNCIGKDLSKIPMPVNFNEPISMLQRLTEDYEYSYLLDRAAECTDPCEQLAYVAAFTVSGYSSTINRTGKPFNPLLGETYECDRTDDLGWRCVAEQVRLVCHHFIYLPFVCVCVLHLTLEWNNKNDLFLCAFNQQSSSANECNPL